MTKVLLLLSAVIMVIAAYFSYANHSSFASTRKHRIETDAQTKTQASKLTDTVKEVVAVQDNMTKAGAELAQETEKLDQTKIKLKNVNNEAERDTHDIMEKQDRLKEVQGKLSELFKTMPPGTTVETLDQAVNQYKTTIANNTKQAEDGAAATKAKQDELKKSHDEMENIGKKIQETKKLFERNSLNATIVAVNSDWGFVVIDAGENKKITPETKLLVTRGQQTVGKLNIVAVEGTKTVANIDQKSLHTGFSIAPGDRVILETLMQ